MDGGLPGFTDTVICPYNKSHVILKGKLQTHLAKCRKNYDELSLNQKLEEKVACSFNSTHIINKAELEYHEKECPDRVVLDHFVFTVGDTTCQASELMPVNNVEMPPCEEDWDAEGCTVSVLDMLKEQASEKNVLRYMQGTSKSKRKHFRLQERHRHLTLDETSSGTFGSEPIGTHTSEFAASKISTDSYKIMNPAALRRPKTEVNSMQVEFDSHAIVGRGRGRIKVNDEVIESFKSMNINPELNRNTGDQANLKASEFKKDEKVALASSNKMNLPTYSKVTSKKDDGCFLKTNFSFPTTEEGFCQLPIPGFGRGKRKK